MSYPDVVKDRMQAEYLRGLRLLFFKCIDELHPAAREDLKDTVFEKLKPEIQKLRSDNLKEVELEDQEMIEYYTQIAKEDPTFEFEVGPAFFNIQWWFLKSRLPGQSSKLADQIGGDLKVWAAKHRINSDWVVLAAIGLLGDWAAASPETPEPNWTVMGSGTWSALTPAQQRLSFSLNQAWWPPLETRTKGRDRIEKEFREFLKDWLDEREELVHKRIGPGQKNNPNAERDMKWLIRYWVNGEYPSKIAKHEDGTIDHKIVDAAVRNMGERIGFERNK